MVAWLSESENNARTVLVVSDQLDSSGSVENLLRQKNYTTLLETNIMKAVQTARILSPPVIILDLNLLRSDWAALIVELTLVTQAQILCVIPKANTRDIFALYEAGARECLLRPVSPLLLIMKVAALIVRQECVTASSAEYISASV